MSECDNVRELLWAYCDGSLDGESSARVKLHLSTCPECARDLRAATATLDGLKRLDRIEPAPDFLMRVWERIDEREAAGGLAGLAPVWSWLRANRVAVMAGSLAFFLALVGVRYGIDGGRAPVAPRTEAVAGRDAGTPPAAGTGSPPAAATGGPATARAGTPYRDDYILRDIPEATPVVSGFDSGAHDTIETRFMTRDVVPPLPYANRYVEPVVQPVSDDGGAF